MASQFRLRQLGRALRAGAVVGYPTEAVYGLGCDPWNRQAVYRLLALKRRSDSKGLILIAADRAQLQPFLGQVEPDIDRRIGESWPGPVTWVMPANRTAPEWITGGRDTIAVRVTAHEPAAALCRAFGGALVSTSANYSGQPAARTALRTRRLFGHGLDAVLSGPTGGLTHPTAIFDARSGQLLRAGEQPSEPGAAQRA